MCASLMIRKIMENTIVKKYFIGRVNMSTSAADPSSLDLGAYCILA